MAFYELISFHFTFFQQFLLLVRLPCANTQMLIPLAHSLTDWHNRIKVFIGNSWVNNMRAFHNISSAAPRPDVAIGFFTRNQKMTQQSDHLPRRSADVVSSPAADDGPCACRDPRRWAIVLPASRRSDRELLSSVSCTAESFELSSYVCNEIERRKMG